MGYLMHLLTSRPSDKHICVGLDNRLPLGRSQPIRANAGLSYSPLQRSWKGGILVSPCPSVCPSVSLSVRLSICATVDRIVSALYLQQCSSDPFNICTSYLATSEGVTHVMFVSKFNSLKFWRILLTCSFDFVFFWLGIQYDSIVWVIMRWRGGILRMQAF